MRIKGIMSYIGYLFNAAYMPEQYLVVSVSLSCIRALQSSTVSNHYSVIKIGALLEKLPKKKNCH